MESESSAAILIGFGCIILVFFVVVLAIVTAISKRKIITKEEAIRALEKKQQVDLFRATATAEENEKSKIASNLHDEIIPVIALTARNLSNHLTQLEQKGVDTADLQKDIQAFTGLAENVREIAHGLIPKLFTSFGLLKSIEAFIKQVNETPDSAAEFHNNTLFSGDLPFSKNDQLIIYRMTLEILNNLIKHTNYDYLKVSLDYMEDNFSLVFAHDGTGITNEEISELLKSSTGIGLKSLQSRALLLDAKIDYFVDGEVSYVKLNIPIK